MNSLLTETGTHCLLGFCLDIIQLLSTEMPLRFSKGMLNRTSLVLLMRRASKSRSVLGKIQWKQAAVVVAMEMTS
jgi:hypothetical protein